MSDSLLSKMDALMNKHRGEADTQPSAPPASAWLPVLTDVLVVGTPPETARPAFTENTMPLAEPHTTPPAPAGVEAVAVSDTLAEQLMSELAPRLSEVMEKQVAAELRKNLDQTVSVLLSQLDVNMREIVRDAVREKLKTPPESPK